MKNDIFLEAVNKVVYEIANAPIRTYPFHHLYIENIFPASFYDLIQSHLPSVDEMPSIEDKTRAKGFDERFVQSFDQSLSRLPQEKYAFWNNFQKAFQGGALPNVFLHKFNSLINERFSDQSGISFYDEFLLILDKEGYSISPHTDAIPKTITSLFYLPNDDSSLNLGTSIYASPTGFTDEGGPHYKRENFHLITTAPFKPNSLFCFFKSNNSWHGVENSMSSGQKRNVLLYDIYYRKNK